MMYMHLLSFYILSHIFVLINLLSLVVLLCQLYNSTAMVAILIKLLLLLLQYLNIMALSYRDERHQNIVEIERTSLFDRTGACMNLMFD